MKSVTEKQLKKLANVLQEMMDYSIEITSAGYDYPKVNGDDIEVVLKALGVKTIKKKYIKEIEINDYSFFKFNND